MGAYAYEILQEKGTKACVLLYIDRQSIFWLFFDVTMNETNFEL